MIEALSCWCVYDKPADYPTSFIARRWLLVDVTQPTVERAAQATAEFIQAETLEEIRGHMRRMRLYRLNRYADDEPHIVEVWL